MSEHTLCSNYFAIIFFQLYVHSCMFNKIISEHTVRNIKQEIYGPINRNLHPLDGPIIQNITPHYGQITSSLIMIVSGIGLSCGTHWAPNLWSPRGKRGGSGCAGEWVFRRPSAKHRTVYPYPYPGEQARGSPNSQFT